MEWPSTLGCQFVRCKLADLFVSCVFVVHFNRAARALALVVEETVPMMCETRPSA